MKTGLFENMRIRGEKPLIFILSGAGLSAESGIPTFRDRDGLWEKYDFRELATSEAIKKTPEKVFEFYNARIKNVQGCRPNAAHIALAEFAKDMEGVCDVIHVTQNVDWLNELAGSPRVFHMHGQFMRSMCSKCKTVFPRIGFYEKGKKCPVCGAEGYSVRPDVILFGEEPYGMDWIFSYLKEADVFISVGTSGKVYPAASFVAETQAPIRININLNPVQDVLRSANYGFNKEFNQKCTEVLPNLLNELKEEILKNARD